MNIFLQNFSTKNYNSKMALIHLVQYQGSEAHVTLSNFTSSYSRFIGLIKFCGFLFYPHQNYHLRSFLHHSIDSTFWKCAIFSRLCEEQRDLDLQVCLRLKYYIISVSLTLQRVIYIPFKAVNFFQKIVHIFRYFLSHATVFSYKLRSLDKLAEISKNSSFWAIISELNLLQKFYTDWNKIRTVPWLSMLRNFVLIVEKDFHCREFYPQMLFRLSVFRFMILGSNIQKRAQKSFECKTVYFVQSQQPDRFLKFTVSTYHFHSHLPPEVTAENLLQLSAVNLWRRSY